MQRNTMYYRLDEFQTKIETLLQFFNEEPMPLPPIPEIKESLAKLINQTRTVPGQMLEIEEVPQITENYSSELLGKISAWVKKATIDIAKLTVEIAKDEAKHHAIHPRVTEPPATPPAEKKIDLRLVRQALQDLTTRLAQMESTYLGLKPLKAKHGIEIEYVKANKLHLPKRHIHKNNIEEIKNEFNKIDLEQKDLQKIIQLKIDCLLTHFKDQITEHNQKYEKYQKSTFHFTLFEDKPLEKYYEHLNQYLGNDYFRMLGVILKEFASKYGSIIGSDKKAEIIALVDPIVDMYLFDNSRSLVRQRSMSSGIVS